MNYRLMHKDIPVAALTIDDITGAIVKLGELYNVAHVPIGIAVKKNEIDRAYLNEWWQGRAIPASRQGIRQALKELNLNTTQNLVDKCMGLSLSDQYWICPVNTSITWAEVNFFENSFSDDVGNVLFGKGSSSRQISLMSPDNTSDGWLKKKWTIIDGKRCLIKGGSGATQQEPYNEVFASAVMQKLQIPHIPYTLMIQEEYPYSVCEDFITPQTELVSAWYIMQTRKKENHVSIYQHYLNCCDALGIPDVRQAIDQMVVLDYLIANEDRHQNNFGVIRNAETLEWQGAAPIYDSGTSLWFAMPTGMIRPASPKMTCKPFKSNHEEQLKLVSTFEWLELSALNGIEEVFRKIVKGSPFIDEARCNAICNAISRRAEMLADFVQIQKRQVAISTDDDVKEDIAYTGKQKLEL